MAQDFLCFSTNLTSSEWAAWVQAIGSIAAIAGSVGVASWQVRRQQRGAEKIEEGRRQDALDNFNVRKSSVKKLVAAELVAVAVGYINAKRVVEAVNRSGVTYKAGGFGPEVHETLRHLAPGMPLTDRLASELLFLNEEAIDALATFQGNMAMTRLYLRQAMDEGAVTSFALMGINQLLRADMEILAECFIEIAPRRKLQMPSSAEPELASELLLSVAAN